MPRRPSAFELERLLKIFRAEKRSLDSASLWLTPEPEGYLHWDDLRHRQPPPKLSHKDWWLRLKLKRMNTRRNVPLLKDGNNKPFAYSFVDPIPEHLHFIDRDAAGRIEVPEEIVSPSTRDRYIVSSLIEESLRSSQIEGAVTTRKAAKEMVRQGRRPRTKSEHMVLNNYRTMEHIRTVCTKKLTPARVFELHRMITEGTLDDPTETGRLRTEKDKVHVVDAEGETMHVPPEASELPSRLKAMCNFATGPRGQEFLNPILRAIILHFWLAYDHPFVDGNGRCARALFYWSMLHEGYWLCEFLSISHVVHRTRRQYYRAFLHTETDDNDLTYFILYHLKVIRDAITDLHKYIQRKAREVRQIDRRLRSTEFLNHRQRDLLSHALRHPDHAYTIAGHRRSHNVVYQTARTDLLDLADRGFLEKRKSGRALTFFVPVDLERRLG